jgi:hypothetical protein
MGVAATWFAVREEHADDLLKELALSPTGEAEELPESVISTARLDHGWRIVWYGKCGCPFLGQKNLGELSRGREILLCSIEEHVMASSAELWSDGRRRWWISHEGEDGPHGLEVEGDLPASFAAIRAEMEEAQRAEGGDDAGVDHIFEIPLKVAQAMVGFKHDEDCPHLLEPYFAVLSRSEPKRGLLGRLLGR